MGEWSGRVAENLPRACGAGLFAVRSPRLRWHTLTASGSAGNDQRVAALGVRLYQYIHPEHPVQRLGLQYLLRSAAGLDTAVAEQQQLVAVAGGEVQVVEDDQHAGTLIGEAAHRIQYAQLVQWVEHGGRLVEQQYLAIGPRPQLRQHPGQMHSLTFAAGQLQVAASAQVLGIHRAQYPGHYLLIRSHAGVVGHAAHAYHLFDAEAEVQAGALRQYRQPLGTRAARPVGQWPGVEQHLAAAGGQFAIQYAKQAALACTVGAQHPQHLARLQGQTDIAQYPSPAPGHAHVLRLQHQPRLRISR